MRIDLDNFTQSSSWTQRHLFIPYYEKLSGCSTPFLRAASLGIGIGDGAMSAAESIAAFVESMFKGSANVVLGVASRDRATFKRGALQITLGGGSLLLLAPVIIACRTLRISAQFASNPRDAASHPLSHLKGASS